MGIFSNPAGSDGQSDRINDIKAKYAAGEISQDHYNDLIADEAVTSKHLVLKRAGLAVLLGVIGFVVVLANT